MKKLKNHGITLISLVVTIIILLILAGISISLIAGGNGILGRASGAVDTNDQATATEKMEMKITYLNMISYGENTRKANLQEIAEGMFQDKEVDYVKIKEQKVASLEAINVTGENSIFVKLKEYPYEFEIGSDLQLASVDGIKIEDDNSNEISNLKSEIAQLKSEMADLKAEKSNNKSAITASSIASYEVNANSKKVNLDTVNSAVGNGLSIENGGIKIGEGINNVLVSASALISPTRDMAFYQCAIVVNDTIKYKGGVRASSNYNDEVSTATHLLNVKEGDIIYLYDGNASDGGTMQNNILTVVEF